MKKYFLSEEIMNLKGKKIAILATDGFEESELRVPQDALEKAGAITEIISLEKNDIKSWTNGNWGKAYQVDHTLSSSSPSDYDALLLPGGVLNPDLLRRSEAAIQFTRDFFEQHKPVAAICHGPQILIDADVVKNRKLTSFMSIRKDLENAGANWVDQEVVCDSGLVTSRTPQDLNAFVAKMIEEVAEGKHRNQTVER